MSLKMSDVMTDRSIWEEWERVRRAIYPFDEFNETEEGRREVAPFELNHALHMYVDMFGPVELQEFFENWMLTNGLIR